MSISGFPYSIDHQRGPHSAVRLFSNDSTKIERVNIVAVTLHNRGSIDQLDLNTTHVQQAYPTSMLSVNHKCFYINCLVQIATGQDGEPLFHAYVSERFQVGIHIILLGDWASCHSRLDRPDLFTPIDSSEDSVIYQNVTRRYFRVSDLQGRRNLNFLFFDGGKNLCMKEVFVGSFSVPTSREGEYCVFDFDPSDVKSNLWQSDNEGYANMIHFNGVENETSYHVQGLVEIPDSRSGDIPIFHAILGYERVQTVRMIMLEQLFKGF